MYVSSYIKSPVLSWPVKDFILRFHVPSKSQGHIASGNPYLLNTVTSWIRTHNQKSVSQMIIQ